jgi:tetratricopeptide (TPR) repeat protein
MKNNIIYLLLISVLTFVRCTEADLTLTPTGQELESSFYQNDEQLAQALWAAYDPLQWVVWGASPFLWGSIASDDAYAGGSDPTDQDSYQLLDVYNLTPVEAGDDDMLQMWRSRFRINYRSNLIIRYSDESKPSGNEAMGHAYFLKAFAYFEMTRMWGGLPIIDDVSPVKRYPRATQDETWAAIEGYCTEAINRLPSKKSLDDNGNGIATKGSAQFLLGKTYLYQKKYNEAIGVLEDLAANPYYALMDSFSGVFWPANRYNQESLFEINFSDGIPPGGDDWGELVAGNVAYTLCGPRSGEVALGDHFIYEWGWGFNQPSQSLVDDYMAMNDIVRMESTIIFSDTITKYNPAITFQNPQDGYWDRKHVRIKGFFGGEALRVNQNTIVMRLADAYLMLAEAYNRINDDANARIYLKRVRERVGLPTTDIDAASGDELFALIKLERRLELALEGDRYYDLIRWGDAATVLGPLGYTNGTPGVTTNGLLPIPHPEIVASEGPDRLEQNPGY